jgi:hypothetical protein
MSKNCIGILIALRTVEPVTFMNSIRDGCEVRMGLSLILGSCWGTAVVVMVVVREKEEEEEKKKIFKRLLRCHILFVECFVSE